MKTRAFLLWIVLLILALLPMRSQGAQPPDDAMPALDGATVAVEGIDTLNPDAFVTVYVQLADAPVIEAWQRAQQKGGPAFAETSAKAQLSRINQAQAQVQRQLVQRGATPLYRLQRVLNAIVVDVRVGDVRALAQIPGVTRIEQLPHHSIDESDGAQLIGAPQLWDAANGLGLTGEGVKIGVIDTGVDYLHTHFGGSGLAEDYAANNRTVISDEIGFPSAKVVGGWDFVGDLYDSGCTTAEEQVGTCTRTPQPDPDPLDCNGHGTHVAGSAAGYGVNADGTTYAGPWGPEVPFDSMHIHPGVAPQAEIYALRIFGCSGTSNLTVSALEWAADPNGDGNFDDHLDIVNLSLGSSYGSNEDLTSRAANNTVAAGTILVTSSGNNGDYTAINNSPGSADWAITVASSIDATDVMDAFVVHGPESIAGLHPAAIATSYDWLTHGARDGTIVYPTGQPSGCQPFNATNTALISGNIALLDWSFTAAGAHECGSAVRTDNVTAAGGIGVLMIWPGKAIDITLAGNASIPAVITNKETGEAIKDLVRGGTGTVHVTLTNEHPSALKIVDNDRVDAISSFSSRGISRDGTLKPDVSAPGQTIFSSNAGTGRYGGSRNGTSMAAPHVAGALALLRQLHPDWSVEELKALIMNTAHVQTHTNGQLGGVPYSPARQGAGRVMLERAAAASAVAYNASEPGLVSLSYGTPQVLGTQSFTRQIRVVNKGPEPVTYTISASNVVTSAGVTVTPLASALSVAPGTSEVFDVRITVNAAQLDRTRDPSMAGTLTTALYQRFFLNEHTGYIRLTPQGGTELRVPFFIAPRPASNMAATNQPLDFATTEQITLTLDGTGINTTSYTSLVWALQLQEISPDEPETTGLQNGGDLAYLGVGSNISTTGTLTSSTTIFFGVAAHGPWALPNASDTRYEFFIDTNRDGTSDFRVYNTTPADGNDVFITAYENLRTGAIATSSFLNILTASTETAPMFTSVMVLPITAGRLGLTAGNSRFDYYVRTYQREYGWNADISRRYTFDPAAPALQALPSASSTVSGRPLYRDLPGTSFGVRRNPASFAIDQPQGLLLLHHLNQIGAQAEVVPLRSYGVAFADATLSASGQPGSIVTHTVTLTNTGNAADTFDITLGEHTWSASAPSSMTVPANSSASIDVLVTVPADAQEHDFEMLTLTATSQGSEAASADATLTTTAERQRIYAMGFVADGLSASGKPRQVLTYAVTLENRGNTDDVYDLALSGHSWASGAPTVVGVPAASSATFEVQVTIPAGAAEDAQDTLTLTATSQARPDVTSTMTITSIAKSTYITYYPVVTR